MLNNGQLYAYNILKAGYSVFLTGDAGTGKTYVLYKFIADAKSEGYNVMVAAPTGIAASNLDGITAHRAFCLPLGVLTRDMEGYDAVPETLLETDIVVIDEISMCRIDAFDCIMSKILTANKHRMARGLNRIQLVLSGDFFQLPPVITPTEKSILDKYYGRDIEAGFAFNSVYWNMFDFKYIILTEIMRQGNAEFIDNLNMIRVGQKAYLNYFLDNCSKTEMVGAITLCGTNIEVNRINTIELSKIAGDDVVYKSRVEGDAHEVDCTANTFLTLKPGARIMTLVNNVGVFNNGTLGYVTTLDDDIIGLRLDDGTTCEIARYTWDIFDYELTEDNKIKKKIVGQITQFPIKLAYAVTIHKSQGQTYEALNLNPYCWDCGQLYVALSRVKDVHNMYLKTELDMRYLVVSLNVISFYNEIVKTANKPVDTSVNLIAKKEVKYSNNDELNKDIMSILDKLRG